MVQRDARKKTRNEAEWTERRRRANDDDEGLAFSGQPQMGDRQDMNTPNRDASSEPASRVRVVYRGNVQGVGFRATTQGIAGQFAVTGWVRNEADRTVQVVAEGTKAELVAFLDRIKHALDHHITGVHIEWSTATGEFPSFSIRR